MLTELPAPDHARLVARVWASLYGQSQLGGGQTPVADLIQSAEVTVAIVTQPRLAHAGARVQLVYHQTLTHRACLGFPGTMLAGFKPASRGVSEVSCIFKEL